MRLYYYSSDMETIEEVNGKSLRDIWRKLARMLSFDGRRSITAAEGWDNPTSAWAGRRVTASLYDGEDECLGRNDRNYL